MNFKNKRFKTRGVNSGVDLLLQMFMWHCIDELDNPDYLQIFNCSMYDGMQKITHIQEQPEYKREYLLKTDVPIFVGKIFVIDDKTHSTMLLAGEY